MPQRPTAATTDPSPAQAIERAARTAARLRTAARNHSASGTLARNVLRGPGLARLDVALARSVRLTERLRLQFRAAVYDLTGRIDYRNPTNVLPHAGFGYLATPIVQAGAVRAGRDAEAELRLVF